jgi:N-acetylmuramoyl-L-alanine amidase
MRGGQWNFESVNTSNRSRRAAHWAIAFLWMASVALPAHARHKSEAWARTEFSRASTMQEALGGRPVPERSRAEYQRVIDAYRRVYLGAPTSTKAEPSVVASAELMVEMGRRFNDPKILNAAVSQYEFLRREYPGSKYRIEALFTIGEIYKDDLDNQAEARETFEDVVQHYPRSHLAAEARKALAEPLQQAAPGKSKSDDHSAEAKKSGESTKSGDTGLDDQSAKNIPVKSDKIPRVTGIRHWSTPDYTRVAIDLEQEVKFSSQRIGSPERIFFDLHNTNLASTLVGKSLDVDDGLLQKIRVAQYQPGRTRIVLEVGETSSYHAFLLPNPPRLMIDIHGKPGTKAVVMKDTNKDTNADEQSLGEKAIADDDTASDDSPAKPSEAKSVPGNDSDDDGSAPAPVAQVKKAPPIRTVLTSSGIKKTVVDADDDPPSAHNVTNAKPGSDKAIEAEDTNTKKAASDDAAPSDNLVAALDEPKLEVAKSDAVKSPAVKSASSDSANKLKSDDVVDLDTDNASTPSARSKARNGKNKSVSDLDMHEAQPRADGDRSLIRALGLKIGKIVIDPGHGGHDTGTIGPNGLEEKDLVLDVSHRLGKLLETKLGSEVVYTRRDDTFIPLETRTAIANREQADLFVSVHANSSHDRDARGVETYYLNFTSSPDALEVAARENAVSEKTVYELQDLVKKIALREKIEESREFAGDVESSLHTGLAAKNPGLRDRGVKKAPFIVLIGANMPSILAEISFVSNPGDEKRLRSPEYRQRIAESLYRGIAKYVSGLSGVKVASRMEREKASGQ